MDKISAVCGETFMNVEFLGILATLFVLMSFLMRKVETIRIINIIGAVLFVIYGICINSLSTWLLNAVLVIIHTVYLIKYKIKK